jgi:hypothetical protein
MPGKNGSGTQYLFASLRERISGKRVPSQKYSWLGACYKQKYFSHVISSTWKCAYAISKHSKYKPNFTTVTTCAKYYNICLTRLEPSAYLLISCWMERDFVQICYNSSYTTQNVMIIFAFKLQRKFEYIQRKVCIFGYERNDGSHLALLGLRYKSHVATTERLAFQAASTQLSGRKASRPATQSRSTSRQGAHFWSYF